MGAVQSVTVEVDAPAARVYALVADLPRMGEWSPECTRCVWLRGAAGAAPGARFRGYNRRGPFRWFTTGTVAVADPGRELTFDVSLGLPVARWSYLIEPLGDDRCRVTERWIDNRAWLFKVGGVALTGVRDREAHNAAGMQATLDRLKAAAETP